MFSIFYSIQRGYLYGDNIKSRFCEEKMTSDIAVLDIILDTMTVAKSRNKRATSFLNQLGLIGNISVTLT